MEGSRSSASAFTLLRACVTVDLTCAGTVLSVFVCVQEYLGAVLERRLPINNDIMTYLQVR